MASAVAVRNDLDKFDLKCVENLRLDSMQTGNLVGEPCGWSANTREEAIEEKGNTRLYCFTS